jgi:hypothetical protein
VSIARGGTFGLPSQAASAALMGVSSFGAQGTNAHALVAGSGAPALATAWSSGQPFAWRRSRCYVAPALQQLLSSCLPRKRSRTVTFDSQLSAARLAYLWQYSVHGRPFLASSALLSMAASLLPLLGLMTEGEDTSQAAVAAAVAGAALVAPVVLPHAGAARLTAAVARLRLAGSTGGVEVAMHEQQLLTARLAPCLVPAGPQGGAGHGSSSPALRQAMMLVTNSPAVPDGGFLAETIVLSAADMSGYAVHPALLDACMGQAAAAADPFAAALPWARSVAALAVGVACPHGGALSAAYQPADGWQAGSASTDDCTLLGVVLGEQDMPPASPGPRSLPPSARMGAAAAAAGNAEEEEGGAGIAADHPLLQMPEEERLLHLQAQVRRGKGRRRAQRAPQGCHNLCHGHICHHFHLPSPSSLAGQRCAHLGAVTAPCRS